MLTCVILGVFVNLGMLWFLVPRYGVVGAAISQLGTEVFSIAFLVVCVARIVRLPPLRLVPVRQLGKVALASGIALVPIYPDFWSAKFGLPGVVVAGIVFAVVYYLALDYLGVTEATKLMAAVKSKLGLGGGSAARGA
jgi:O-antigen/teichoic acid export membrane protein